MFVSNVKRAGHLFILGIYTISFLFGADLLNIPKAKAAELTNWVDGSGKSVSKTELDNTDWTKRIKFLSPINIFDSATDTVYTYKGDLLFGNQNAGLLQEDEYQFLFFPDGKPNTLVKEDKSNCYGIIVWYITDNTSKSNLELAQPKLSSSGAACSIDGKAVPENTELDPKDSYRIIDDSDGDWRNYVGSADWAVAPFYWTSKDSLGIYDTERVATKITDSFYDNIKQALQDSSLYDGLLSAPSNILEFWEPGECKTEVLVTEKSSDGKVLPYGNFIGLPSDPRTGIPDGAKIIRIGVTYDSSSDQTTCMLGRKLTGNSYDVINYSGKIPIAFAAQVNDPASNPVVAPPVTNANDGVLAGDSCYSNIANVFGFLLCPLFDAIDKFVVWAENALTGQLTVDLGNSETRDNLESAWQQMARIASSLLVIIGLLMIASTAFGFKFFDAYTVKKVLPRIVIGAVGIWFSWALVTTYVDFMNALGQALGGIMLSQFNGGEAFSLTEIWARATEGAGNASSGLATGLFVGLAGWAAISAGPFIILGLGLTTLVGFAIAIAVLTIRQAIIIFLAILAPVAIASWILPNTKPIWNKWFKLFNSLLLMYPLIIGTLAAGKIFALIAASRLDGQSETTDELLGITISVISYVGPLFLIPGLIKSSNSMMGKLSGGISKATSKATGGVNSALNGAAKNRKAIKGLLADANAPGNSKFVSGQGFAKGAWSAQKAVRARGRMNLKNLSQGAIGAGEASQLIRAETAASFSKRAAEVGNIQLRNSGVGAVGTQYTFIDADRTSLTFGTEVTTSNIGDALKSYAAGSTLTTTDSSGNISTFDHSNTSSIARSALFGKMATDGNIEALRSAIATGSEQARAANEAISNNSGAVIAKAPDLIKSAKGAFKEFKASDVVGWDASTLTAAMTQVSSMPRTTPEQIADSNKAMATLNESIKLIADTPALKQSFSAKQVLAIRDHAAAGSVLSSGVASRLMTDGTIH